MDNTNTPHLLLSDWLSAVRAHLDVEREHMRPPPKNPRNRKREKARREARLLLRQYEAELAVDRAA